MSIKLLTEQHLELLSLKGGWVYTCKMPPCWKSHVTAHLPLVGPTVTQLVVFFSSDCLWVYRLGSVWWSRSACLQKAFCLKTNLLNFRPFIICQIISYSFGMASSNVIGMDWSHNTSSFVLAERGTILPFFFDGVKSSWKIKTRMVLCYSILNKICQNWVTQNHS